MIIGLTGRNASGKGEVAQYLIERGFFFYSLSDALRDELKRVRKPVTRTNLTWLGNNLRNEFGPSILAEKIIKKIEDDRHYVIDSFRNPEEVQAFRRTKDFVLISIEASPKLRFERMKARNRERDAQTFKEFLDIEQRELKNADPTKQNLEACRKLSDLTLSNNGTIAQLHNQINSMVSKLLMKAPRPSWDQYFMQIAKVVATRSNCMKRRVAAVIIKDKRIISTGYNGTPRGITNCMDGGCPRCNSLGPSGKNLGECYCSHAEENAITQAAYHGISIKEAVIYSTFSPCLLCTKMIINSGIKEVVFNEAYSLAKEAIALLQQAKITVRQISSHGKMS